MIVVGLKANMRAFSPWFIYNSTCWACQVQECFLSPCFSQIRLLGESAFVHDAQFPVYPSSGLTWSIFCGFKSRQIQRL